MSIGLDDVNMRRKVNLTQLRKNTRSRTEKRSGRKAPRPGDYCVEPAPDAMVRSYISFLNQLLLQAIPDECQQSGSNEQFFEVSQDESTYTSDNTKKPQPTESTQPTESSQQIDKNEVQAVDSIRSTTVVQSMRDNVFRG